MPPRLAVVAIALFWLASMGWLAYRDWWPWWRADSPPPIAVELADEAAPQVAHWSLWRGDKKIGAAMTTLTCQKDDSIKLSSAITDLDLEMGALALKVQIKILNLTTDQYVSREGELRSLESKIDLRISVAGENLSERFEARLAGTVQDGKLHSKYSIAGFEQVLDPIPLQSGSMLNPLQPMARIRVKAGQKWTITSVDPMQQILRAAIAKFGVNLPLPKDEVVLATVLDDPQVLTHRDKPVSCFVIEYRSEKMSGATWVEVESGKVLRQEMTRNDDKMVLLRED